MYEKTILDIISCNYSIIQEEYDSEPTTTSSEDESDDFGSGSDAERKREEKRKQKAEKKTKKAEKEKKSGEPKEKRTKKKKLTRLPGQPKKNQSAYFLWMNHNREQIKKDYPGLSMTDMTKKAGELWRDLQDKTVSRIICQVSWNHIVMLTVCCEFNSMTNNLSLGMEQ